MIRSRRKRKRISKKHYDYSKPNYRWGGGKDFEVKNPKYKE